MFPEIVDATSSRAELSIVPDSGTFQTFIILVCGTLSKIISLFVLVLLAIHFLGFAKFGPAGISPKYLFTKTLAVSKSISPAKTNTALLGP